MRVLIDCTQITRQKAGVGVYAINLVRELVRLERECRLRNRSSSLDDRTKDVADLWLLVQDDDPDFAVEDENVRVVRVPSRLFRILPMRLLLEQIYIPWLARRLKLDVIHSLHYSLPLIRTKARKIVTIHDLTSYRMPEVHTRVKRLYFPFFLRAASRRADALVFVSHYTQEDWRHYFPASDVPQFVIPLGKAPEYRPDLSSSDISKVLQQYGIHRPYLLYIGTIEPRKNLTRLVEAFASIRDSAPQYLLVIAGKKGWMYDDLFRTVSTLGLAESVVFTGFVEEQDKPFLIAGADVFVYPSLYEGFGIPVLEALSCGTPTLTSDSSSLREVAGDAAVLANPESVHDIAAKLGQLLGSQTLRALLAERGIAQASRFSWTRMAIQTREVYFALGQSYEGEGNALGC